MLSGRKTNSRSHFYPPYIRSTGNKSKLLHLPATTCSSSSPPFEMASLNSNTNYRHLSENTTNLGSIYTAVTAKIELSSHPPYDLHAYPPCMPPTRAHRPRQKHQSSGLASQTPPEAIAHTATGWPHHRRHYHPHPPPYRSTHFSAYAQTTGHTYLVIVDRYSNWPIVERAKDRVRGLINVLRQTFATYGIPDELSSDGGPEFVAHTTRQFLHHWGIHHCLSSAAFPHSNYRAAVVSPQKGVRVFSSCIKRCNEHPHTSSSSTSIYHSPSKISLSMGTLFPFTLWQPQIYTCGSPLNFLQVGQHRMII